MALGKVLTRMTIVAYVMTVSEGHRSESSPVVQDWVMIDELGKRYEYVQKLVSYRIASGRIIPFFSR